MAFLGQSLADGQVSTTKAAIYTVPTSRRVIIKSLIFYNTNATSQTLNVYIKRNSGTSRQIERKSSFAQYAHHNMFEDGDPPWILSAGDSVEADTTTASAVDYIMMGAVEII